MAHVPTRLLGQSPATLRRARMEIGRRYRQVHRIWRANGALPILDRLRRALSNWIAPPVTPLPVRPSDVLTCDLTAPRTWLPLRAERGERLIVNWVTTPPGAGSGGHTTMFRL